MSSSSFSSSSSWAEFKQGLLEIPIATTSKSNGSDDDNPGSSHGDDRNDRRTSSDDSVAIIDDGDDDGGDASDNSKLNENFTIDAATQLQSKQSSISSEICASLQVKDKSTMATHPTETITEKEKEAQLAASELLRPLTPAEEGIVKKALYAIGPPRDILASFHGDSVQRRSMQTLQPGRWINDEIVNYFFKNCLAKRDERLCSTQPGRKRSHFFNTFFVQALFDDKNSNAAKRGKYNYNNVKRWSKKVPGKDIFNLKYVVCPMNLDEMHWTLAVIFMEEKKICYYDSMGETEWTKLEGLLKYLKDEHISKNGKELEGWEEWQLLGCPDNIPSQFNGYDCGIFTCMFAYFISNDYPLAFTQQHVDRCREWIAIDIINNGATELCSSGRRTRSAEG